MDAKLYMPIPDSFWQIAPEADRFLVSYPRSGSRWLRLLLADIAFCLSDLDPTQLYEGRYERETSGSRIASKGYNVHGVCPDIYITAQRGQFKYNPKLIPLLRPVFRSHSLASLDRRPGCRVVYLFRPPSPMLVSYIHFARSEGYLSNDLAELEPFCMSRVEEWVTHIEHAISHVETAGERACMVRYLDQTPFSIAQLRKVMTVLDIPASDKLIDQALIRLEDMFERMNLSGCFVYTRGSNQENLQSVPGITASLVEAVHNRTQSVFERACRIERERLI